MFNRKLKEEVFELKRRDHDNWLRIDALEKLLGVRLKDGKYEINNCTAWSENDTSVKPSQTLLQALDLP